MKVACCQMDIVWENKPANYERARELVAGANLPAGALLALPEMFSTGFSMNVEAAAETENCESERFLSELARGRGLYVLGGVVGRNPDGRGRNESVTFDPEGPEIARYQKMQPFSLGGESVHFTAGSS